MASPIEESFIKNHLIGKTIFEFGCSPGRFASELVKMGYKVVGVDLYEPEFKESYTFIRKNILEFLDGGLTIERADNVLSVSSIEHCGIERDNFCNGGIEDQDSHYDVAMILSTLLSPGGQLIVTVPFGDGNVYFVDKDGNNGTRAEIPQPYWGFRTFNKESISDLFPTLDMVKCVAYEKLDNGDYFDMLSWREVSLDTWSKYNNKKRAVMCCIFK